MTSRRVSNSTRQLSKVSKRFSIVPKTKITLPKIEADDQSNDEVFKAEAEATFNRLPLIGGGEDTHAPAERMFQTELGSRGYTRGTSRGAKEVNVVQNMQVDDDIERNDQGLDVDSDYDTDIEIEDSEEIEFQKLLELDRCTRSYVQSCIQFGLEPKAHVKDQLRSNELNLRHTLLTPDEILSLLIALCSNTTVTSLSLSDCHVTVESLDKLEAVLTENVFVSHINLSHNHFGTTGAAIIGSILASSRHVTSMRLAACGFGDGDCRWIAEALEDDNRSLTTLDLSHNQFREHAGVSLSSMMASNEHLRTLNLAWNHLRRRGALEIATGLARNSTLTTLNLAYNGFGDDGASAIARALLENETLQRLNLNNNRISNRGAVKLGESLKKNQVLKVLKISENPISPYGVHFLLAGIRAGRTLFRLHIESLPVDLLGARALDAICEQNKSFVAAHGPRLEKQIKNYGNSDYIVKMEIFDQIREYLHMHNMRMVDLFNIWYKDKELGGLTYEQMKSGLDDANIPVTRSMLTKMFRALDSDQNGTISYDEFIAVSHL